MISHPFEIKASVSDTQPEVLMITWRGAPAQSIAEMYLPAVASADIVALADTIYGRHRLTATDANTIQFPAADLTLIPIPAGAGAYAGLLSVDARPAVPQGHDFSVAVRQLEPVTAPHSKSTYVSTVRDADFDTESIDEDQQRSPEAGRSGEDVATHLEGQANLEDDSSGTEWASAGAARASSSWRRVRGAFQFTFTGKAEHVLVAEQVRLLSWLKWRVGVTPEAHRWNLVLKRYLKYTADVVWGLGTDPNSIGPSEIGKVGDLGHHGDHGDAGSKDPALEEHEATGKVSAIHYDRFGDFRGFTILTERGHDRDYFSTEYLVEEVVRTAWVERSVVRVISDEHHPERPDRLILLRPH